MTEGEVRGMVKRAWQEGFLSGYLIDPDGDESDEAFHSFLNRCWEESDAYICLEEGW